jgi:hypothetical protein
MFQGIEIGTAILIFFGYFIMDIISSWFLLALNKLQITTTTILTFLLYIGSGAGIYQYTHHFFYLVFAAFGASLGNYILVVVEKRRQRYDKESK